MINERLRTRWDAMMTPLGRALGRTPVTPNAVTLFGLAVTAVVALLIVQGRFLAAGVVAIVGGFADAFDGALAKAQGRTSSFGALLDSTTDRMSDALIFGAIAWFYGVADDGPDRPEVAALALATLAFSFLVPYIRARAEGLGFECRVGIAERAERLILIIVGLLIEPLLPVMVAAVGALALITIVQRLFHVRSQAYRVR